MTRCDADEEDEAERRKGRERFARREGCEERTPTGHGAGRRCRRCRHTDGIREDILRGSGDELKALASSRRGEPGHTCAQARGHYPPHFAETIFTDVTTTCGDSVELVDPDVPVGVDDGSCAVPDVAAVLLRVRRDVGAGMSVPVTSTCCP